MFATSHSPRFCRAAALMFLGMLSTLSEARLAAAGDEPPASQPVVSDGGAGDSGSGRTALFDEIWGELATHDAFFDAVAPETLQLAEQTRAALRECPDETERLRIVIRTLSRLGDGHLHLTTRWFLPDKPPPPIDLAGGQPMFRPPGGFSKFRRDYYMRIAEKTLNEAKPVSDAGGSETDTSELDRANAASHPEEVEAPHKGEVDCRVVAIDGGAVSHGGGWALLNGPRDTKVDVIVERPDGRFVKITRTRTRPVNPPKHFAPTTQVVTTRPDGTVRTEDREVVIESRRLDGNLGYIRIVHLVTTQVIADFNAALDGLMDTDGLILDIRDNHGGYPWIMMPIVGRFFKDYQRVCSFDGRSPAIGALVRSVGKVGIPPVGKTYQKPMVVLVNDDTASMGEGLAFVLGDTGRAVLLGRPTMGLNAAIRNTTLKNGLVLWHSWIRVNRLNGTHYQGVGVQPHELVQLGEERWRSMGIPAAIDAERELQFQTAIQKLRGMVGK